MLLPFSLFQFLLPIFLLSSACIAQLQAVQYLINCGSSDKTTYLNREFSGDNNRDLVSFSKSKTAKDNQPADPSMSLYQTARFFRKSSTYNFNLPQNGTYFVRLHFYAFSSSLADAEFNVSASSRMLLTDFTPGKNATTSPIIKEFILTVNQIGEFKIHFVPSPSSSLAFVNAIEVLSTASNITGDGGVYATPVRKMGNQKSHKHEVLETIYRINVGGTEVKPAGDLLGRIWKPDDQYLTNKGDAQNGTVKTDVVSNNRPDNAPTVVYGTAKVLNSQISSNIPNLTWSFNVNKGTKYFVRVHFCDTITTNGLYIFTFYISSTSNYSEAIAPHAIARVEEPFQKDYVVESNDLGTINITVGPNNGSVDKTYFFLNGLEIMQVMNESVLETPKEHNAQYVLIVSLVASAVALILVLAAIVVRLYLKKREKKTTETFEWGSLPLYGATSTHNRTSEGESSHASTFQSLHLGLKIPFAAIQQVTNNFDVNLIIGEGGFGKVYKGTLGSGLKIAVKRGSSDHGQGISEFQTEIMILSKIRHRHLVSLIGYCCENDEMILVYEFMEKGTLRHHLYESKHNTASSTQGVLSWKKRLEICIGAAKGIQYLHSGTNMGIIHRDVKSTNILLDENYVAKVADFGLSRSGYLEESHVSISDVKGTLGYLDPEYVTCLQLTEKSDVYSFGVVLLEVLCARPVIDHSLPREQVSLSDWVMTCYEEGQLEAIIDPLIAVEINPNSLKKFCETAKRCLQKDAADRPPMSDVCWGLEYALQLQKLATERVALDDSTTDASLNMPLPAVRRFPSQSIVDDEYDDELLNTGTGEVFSQLTFEDGTAR